MLELNTPYLLFLADATSEMQLKTAHGLAYWRPELCVGQLRLPACTRTVGLPDMTPEQAFRAGARSVVIGRAPAGGALAPRWVATLVEAMEAGLDVVSGLHTRLAAVPELADAAARTGRRLVDVRVPPPGIPVASGRRRSGKRLLTVGTDCCVGKKYTALALHRAMREAGMKATFRATGQTGILIAGAGMPIDAVVCDFLPGAAEILSPDNDPDHWDVIEGQGSLFHPAYAAVTLGLVHGSQPDALVLCHEAGRSEIDCHPGYAIPSLHLCIERYLEATRLTNTAVRCVGISVNTSGLREEERLPFLQALGRKSGLPCVDPVATGVRLLLEALSG